MLKKINTHTGPNETYSKPKIIVQPKLQVNAPGDIYEQEADAMADRVMRMTSNETAKPVTGLIGKSLQRKCAHCEEEKKKPIMRKTDAGNSGMQVSSSFASSLHASKGGGSPLPQDTKSFMENAFSTDFSSVKIHTGTPASEMSKGINAKAFTYGNDIYFKDGQYSPNTYGGKSLLAHELTHVRQQGASLSIRIMKKDLTTKVKERQAECWTLCGGKEYGSTECELGEDGLPNGKVSVEVKEDNPCTKPCVEVHENSHKKDMKHHCETVHECIGKGKVEDEKTDKCLDAFDKKLSENGVNTECKAYEAEIGCLNKRKTKKICISEDGKISWEKHMKMAKCYKQCYCKKLQ